MIKIQIKSIFGNLLFEYEGENNTTSETLRRAVLEGAVLEGADLRGADLRRAVLRGADLRGAVLEGADLRGADLRGVKGWEDIEWTNQCKRDILFILQSLKSEIPNLRKSIMDGKIDGTQYTGECACLVGTLGKEKGVNKVCEFIPFYTKGLHNFGEQFFYQIRKGDTPENSGFSKIAVELCDMVLNEMK